MNLLKTILVGLAGPVFTFVVYASGEGWNINFVELFIPICICVAVSIAIAFVTQHAIDNFKRSIIISTIICDFIYVFFLICTAIFADPENSAEVTMWLPVMIIFMIPYCLPMAFTISYATIKISRDANTSNSG